MAKTFLGLDAAAWQAWAAILQAFLSAVAVFAAAKLQDRSLARRDAHERLERWEAVALISRQANETFARVIQKFENGMDPSEALRIYEIGHFAPAARAVESVVAADLNDLELMDRWFDFEEAWVAAFGRVRLFTDVAKEKRSKGLAVDARSFFAQRDTALSNAAAAVERRVAAMVKRTPKL